VAAPHKWTKLALCLRKPRRINDARPMHTKGRG
jgi:hypothetical protein